MNAVGDDFSGDIGLGKDSANHAWIAVRERAHGVVEMHGMARSGLDSGASLFVIRVGVADSGHDPICNCGADQIQGTGDFGSNGEDTDQAVRGGAKFIQDFYGRPRDAIGWMDSPASF